MVDWKMDGPARDRVLKLIQEKDRLEAEIRDHTAVLENNHIGMHEPLVDDQGYPRNDIDVYKVRHARHQIICLQNDHKNLMKMIERGLNEVHADLVGSNGEQPAHAPTSSTNGHVANGQVANGHVANGQVANGHVANGHVANGRVTNGPLTNGHVANGISSSSGDRNTGKPFAVITLVDDGSPAEEAGLRANDEILRFGSVTHTNFDSMVQINNIVTHSIGQPIMVQVKRRSLYFFINLVPRPWAQPGLLGCHIQRIS